MSTSLHSRQTDHQAIHSGPVTLRPTAGGGGATLPPDRRSLAGKVFWTIVLFLRIVALVLLTIALLPPTALGLAFILLALTPVLFVALALFLPVLPLLVSVLLLLRRIALALLADEGRPRTGTGNLADAQQDGNTNHQAHEGNRHD